LKPGTPGFRGKRLLEAREARRITGAALAEALNITRGAISQYENDLQTPRPEVMSKLASALELPVAFFLREPEEPRSGTVYYRSLAAATKAVRTSALRRHEWLRHIKEWLEEWVDLPRPDFPDFNPPSEPALIKEHIERFAQMARRYWGMHDGPISNVVWLLENKGTIVSLCDFGSEDLDAFSECGRETFAPFISISSSKTLAARANFTAAHELGHLLLHRNIPASVAWSPAQHKEMEKQANDFASAFLLPEATFRGAVSYPSLDLFQALKPKWRVSIGAMIMRSHSLGMVGDEEYQRLWVTYSRRGWKHGEPFDDILDRGGPRILRRAFEVLVNDEAIGRDEILNDLPYAPRDIETLCGLDAGFFNQPSVANIVKLSRPTLAGSEINKSPVGGIGNVVRFKRK
jgi:Zn-dependent peptidase ImmA (M78 family)/DNA-binding XRE family transcriptional regulator